MNKSSHPPARPSATIVVAREGQSAAEILLVRRRAGDAFGDSYAFPGGVVDHDESGAHIFCAGRSAEEADAILDVADGLDYYSAAIRELFEETGQILGKQAAWPDPVPDGWQAFATEGYRPIAEPLQFVFRAITPPGRPRRISH